MLLRYCEPKDMQRVGCSGAKARNAAVTFDQYSSAQLNIFYVRTSTGSYLGSWYEVKSTDCYRKLAEDMFTRMYPTLRGRQPLHRLTVQFSVLAGDGT